MYQFFTNPMVEEMANALSVKCEPCLLTDYTQLFVALDGILGANLDFELQGGRQSVVHSTPSFLKQSSFCTPQIRNYIGIWLIIYLSTIHYMYMPSATLPSHMKSNHEQQRT